MSDADKPSQKNATGGPAPKVNTHVAVSQSAREARLAENLRANLRRRKAASRKSKTSEK